jgi:RNA polymerase sigma-70 factor (ECF subfamily)
MTDETGFTVFLARVRAGDAEAAAELVRRYEPAIRLEVRYRLRNPRLRRLFDSMDVCQSVLASFFVRAAAGLYDLADSRDLVRLLVVMARHKAIAQARRQQAGPRDHRRVEAAGPEQVEAAAVGPSPSFVVANRELLEAVRQRLSAEERQLADRRAQGQEWAQVAAEMGGTAQARRKQLARALARVSVELGLEDGEAGDV